MSLIAWLIGTLALIVGMFMLAMAAAMFWVHPIHLLWFIPLMAFLYWRLHRRIFRVKPMSPERARQLAYGKHLDSTEHHYVEPVTMGGHTRRTHHGRMDGETRP